MLLKFASLWAKRKKVNWRLFFVEEYAQFYGAMTMNREHMVNMRKDGLPYEEMGYSGPPPNRCLLFWDLKEHLRWSNWWRPSLVLTHCSGNCPLCLGPIQTTTPLTGSRKVNIQPRTWHAKLSPFFLIFQIVASYFAQLNLDYTFVHKQDRHQY